MADLSRPTGHARNEPGLAHILGQRSATESQPRPMDQICTGLSLTDTYFFPIVFFCLSNLSILKKKLIETSSIGLR